MRPPYKGKLTGGGVGLWSFKDEREQVTISRAELVTESSPDFWANKINEQLANGVKLLIAAGRDLLAARARLGHGKFKSLFEPGKLRVDRRTAQMLIRISKNAVLANASNCSHLPPTLKALDQLARVDEQCLQMALEQGQVKPTLTIVETRSLVAALKKQNRPSAAAGNSGDK